jgi:hypothetical protein
MYNKTSLEDVAVRFFLEKKNYKVRERSLKAQLQDQVKNIHIKP